MLFSCTKYGREIIAFHLVDINHVKRKFVTISDNDRHVWFHVLLKLIWLMLGKSLNETNR